MLSPAQLNILHREHYARLAALEAQRLGLANVKVRTTDATEVKPSITAGIYRGTFRHTDRIVRLKETNNG
jgi:hypothetical protein